MLHRELDSCLKDKESEVQTNTQPHPYQCILDRKGEALLAFPYPFVHISQHGLCIPYKLVLECSTTIGVGKLKLSLQLLIMNALE